MNQIEVITNKIDDLFYRRKKRILSVYFTAGYPKIDATATIITNLEQSGVDLIEIGIPFSDPVADGDTIQHSNHVALKNGMTIRMLFEQLRDIRNRVEIPLIMIYTFTWFLVPGRKSPPMRITTNTFTGSILRIIYWSL